MQAQIEILKLFSCLPFLLYASYSDLKHRKVSNRVWKGMLAALFVFVFAAEQMICQNPEFQRAI
ncbi:MAG: A24 family peptidase, partial [Methanosarcinaceae archaeon]|nr:A24 family peptidase [Methanosarcinaceae archaeon]